jgi:hypothetical protein
MEQQACIVTITMIAMAVIAFITMLIVSVG